jgi:hypothetical protein
VVPFQPGNKFGGDEGDRTPDLCNAIAALSQLSYVPELVDNGQWITDSAFPELARSTTKQTLSIFRFPLSTGLSALKDGFAFFEEGGDAFFFVFRREAKGEEVDLAAEAFVEV